MVLDAVSNFVRGRVSAPVATSDTTVSVEDASIFPDPSTDGDYNVVIWDANNFPRPDQDADVEIVRVTARDTGTNELTVVRAQETTSDVAHPEGSALHLSPTAKMFSDIEAEYTAQGENFDGQGTSEFENLQSLSTEELNNRSPIYATPDDDLQAKADQAENGTLELTPGDYYQGPIFLPENIKMVIPKAATVGFDPEATLEEEDGVINAIGETENLFEGVTIELEGAVDGSHPDWEPGDRIEAIELDRCREATVRGSGVIHDAPEDGIDIDACRNVFVRGLTVRNNGGFGIHLGGDSGDDIDDQYAQIEHCTAISNGFASNRGGFDKNQRWEDAIYSGCVAVDNYRNWEIAPYTDGSNSGVLSGCQSIDTGSVVAADDVSGAEYAQVDGTVRQTQSAFKARTTTSQSVDDDTAVEVEWDSLASGIESSDLFDLDTNTGEIEVLVPGVYRVESQVASRDLTAGTEIRTQVLKNGISVSERWIDAPDAFSAVGPIWGIDKFDVGDTITISYRHREGSTVDIIASEQETWVSVTRVE